MNKLLVIAFAVLPCLLWSQRDYKNVLFIAVDDLRTELGCYGADYMHTPNIDQLSSQGLLFERAYCQQAICAPSRASVLTGLRPDALGFYDLKTPFREKVPDVITLPQHFRSQGYQCEAIGKILHPGKNRSDDKFSWTAATWDKRTVTSLLADITKGDTSGLQSDYPKIGDKFLPYYMSDAPESNMTDYTIAQQAIERIDQLKNQPFFLAVGFIKPHLPFVAPKKYWDLYDPLTIDIPARQTPEYMPDLAMNHYEELRNYYGIPDRKEAEYLSDDLSRNLIHGYRASVSMIDAQIGRVLDALDEHGLSENTIVVLWGDHGYKLGDYGGWTKHTNFEIDTHVPLIIRDLSYEGGRTAQSLAELVDIYPTLCELANLELPTHIEGQSLKPILEDTDATVNKVAISQYPRGKKLGYDNKQELMGYSIFDGNFRFTRWQKYENPEEVVAYELYDHTKQKMAFINLAAENKNQDKISKYNQILDQELTKYSLQKAKK